MKRIALSLVTVFLACGSSSGSGSTTQSPWTFTDDHVDFGISGVSPGATVMPDGTVRLYVSDTNGGTIYRSSDADGLHFHVESHGLPGVDPTVLALPGGGYRMYFRSVSGTTQTIMTTTSTDGLAWIPGVSTGISDSSGTLAWGVPDAVRAPDGTTRLFWVSNTKIESATSNDGVTFVQDPGDRMTAADPQIMRAAAGDWVGIFSTTPATPPQVLHLGSSLDGRAWALDPNPIVSYAPYSAIDPTSIPIAGTNRFRIYFGVSDGTDPLNSTYHLHSGILQGP